MAVRCLPVVALLLSASLGSGQPPTRDQTAQGKLNRLIHDLEVIIQRQEAIKRELPLCFRSCGQRGPNYPRLQPPEMTVLNAGEKATITVGIDWRLYKESQLPIKVEKSPADADIEIPGEIDLDEEKHPERFEIPVKAGKKPGVYKLILTPFRGEPVEFKIEVK